MLCQTQGIWGPIWLSEDQCDPSMLGFYISPCSQLIVLLNLHAVLILKLFLVEIITNKTTQANLTWPLGHQASIFTYPRTKFTCLGQIIRRGIFSFPIFTKTSIHHSVGESSSVIIHHYLVW